MASRAQDDDGGWLADPAVGRAGLGHSWHQAQGRHQTGIRKHAQRRCVLVGDFDANRTGWAEEN